MNERFCNILYAAVFKQARNNQIQCVLRKNSVSDIVTRAVIIGVSRIIPVKHALFDVIPGAVIVCEPRIVPIKNTVFDVIPIKPTDLLLCLLLNISADGYGFISDIIKYYFTLIGFNRVKESIPSR